MAGEQVRARLAPETGWSYITSTDTRIEERAVSRPPFLIAAIWVLAIAPARAQADDQGALTAASMSSAITTVASADLILEALLARERHDAHVANTRYLTIIDYRRPSNEPRLYLIDFETGSAEALLVAHGQGSDPDHDGVADAFSNLPGSRMSSLGAFVTGDTYYGRHGLSLRLHGLEPDNDNAFARAIVIHGADYVSPSRTVLGRSWGCPALETAVADRVINTIAEGTFVYAVA